MTDPRSWEQEVELARIRRQIRSTPADVMRIARDNQIVATVVRAWQEGDFRTWEEAMTAAVCYLARQNEELLKTATMKIDFAQFPPVVIDRQTDKKASP